MSNQNVRPRITWGSSFANVLTIGYPLDDFRAYSSARDGSEFIEGMSGIRDAWIIGHNYFLEGTVRWIPASDSATQTGWNGVTGWRAFLESARQMIPFRFYPNASTGTYYTSYLVEPIDGMHAVEIDGTRSLRLKITNSSGSYDGY